MTWKPVKLGDVCTVGRGSSPRPIKDDRFFIDGTIPWVKIADATSSGKYIYHTNQYVNEYGASFSRLLPPGSLIFPASGTLGIPRFLGVDACIHDGWLYFSDYRGIEPDFLYYLLITLKGFYESIAYGAAIQNINTELVRNTEIVLPDGETQLKIACALSVYDDLIAANQRRIQLLEESARLLYREWFVKLRFPGHETVPVQNGVPEGWPKKTLGDICDDIRDAVDPNELPAGTPYLSMEHMPQRSLSLSEWDYADKVGSTKLRFSKDDVLFGKIRPYFHKVGIAPIYGITSTDVIAIRARKPDFLSLVALTVSSDDFIAHAVATSNGTKMPRADWKVLKNWDVLIPPEQFLAVLNNALAPILEEIQSIGLYNRSLREARDLLLPKLMSGALDVSRITVPQEVAA